MSDAGPFPSRDRPLGGQRAKEAWEPQFADDPHIEQLQALSGGAAWPVPTMAAPVAHDCFHAACAPPVPPASPRPPAMPTRTARKSAATPARLARENAHDEIYEKIYVAILEHRLHPGTKLVEERLAEIFDVSRARVREVLARLAHEHVVEIFPQRRLVETLTPEKIARLRTHQELEMDARRRDDKRAIVRLSGEFHTLLAELAGNTALARSMRELSTLTCLVIFLYDAPTATSCRADEHSQIIEAIAKRDAARAEKLMMEHLDHIESSLRLDSTAEEPDLEAIFNR